MKTKSFNMGLFYFLGAVLWFAAVEARSDERKYQSTTNNYQIGSSSPACDPVANAGNEIHFDSGTDDLQLGAGYATCGDLEGAKISVGQRICTNCPLLNFSYGKQEGKNPVIGVGTTWKVKW